MLIERLTAEDQLMLWPDEVWPQDIGAIAILDGAGLLDSHGLVRVEAVRDHVSSRLHLVPRFRQLLHVPPPELGGPLWVDDPAFDVTEHVRVLEVPPPGDEAALLAAIEQLRPVRMDRSRPLWEMWLLPGLAEKRVGLFMRTHHCIADGIAGLAAFGAFLDATREPVVSPTPSWNPAKPPSIEELRVDERQRRAVDRRHRLSVLAHPMRGTRDVLSAWPAMRELLAEKALPATSLDRPVGRGRTIALLRDRLDLVREVAHAHGAKVNDVVLTATAGGLRDLLRSRGEPIADAVMRVYVPVSLRHGQYAGARGNQIAQMVVPLPIGVSDPVRRLHLIALETANRKGRSRPSLGKMPHQGMLGSAFLKLINRQRVNVTTADLPGPPVPLFFAGACVLEVFPLLPLIGRVSLGVGALSYGGQFNITVVGDRETYPDLHTFAAGVHKDLLALEASFRSSAVA